MTSNLLFNRELQFSYPSFLLNAMKVFWDSHLVHSFLNLQICTKVAFLQNPFAEIVLKFPSLNHFQFSSRSRKICVQRCFSTWTNIYVTLLNPVSQVNSSYLPLLIPIVLLFITASGWRQPFSSLLAKWQLAWRDFKVRLYQKRNLLNYL